MLYTGLPARQRVCLLLRGKEERTVYGSDCELFNLPAREYGLSFEDRTSKDTGYRERGGKSERGG